jgi:hypothetical protein
MLGSAETSEELHRALLEEDEAAPSRASVALSALAPGLEAEPADPEERRAPEAAPDAGPSQPPVASLDTRASASLGPEQPPLPDPDVAIGLVWPAAAGREILRRVADEAPVLRSDLVGKHGVSDGSGSSDAIIYQAGAWCLKTSLRRRFEDADQGRSALLHLARRKTMLGALCPPRTVLCLRPAEEGRAWLWTVAPWLTTLRTWMAQAETARDEGTLELALTAFAEAAVQALSLAARSGLVLDVHPSNFTLADGRIAYLDDDIALGSRVPAIGHALLRRVDEYAAWPAATAAYVDTLHSSVTSALSPAELSGLGLPGAVEDAIVTTPAGREAQRRLVARLVEACGAPS